MSKRFQDQEATDRLVRAAKDSGAELVCYKYGIDPKEHLEAMATKYDFTVSFLPTNGYSPLEPLAPKNIREDQKLKNNNYCIIDRTLEDPNSCPILDIHLHWDIPSPIRIFPRLFDKTPNDRDVVKTFKEDIQDSIVYLRLNSYCKILPGGYLVVQNGLYSHNILSNDWFLFKHYKGDLGDLEI